MKYIKKTSNGRKIKYFFLLFPIIFFVSKVCVASEMVFVPASDTVAKGELIKVSLYLLTGEDRINAAEGKLIFPSEMLSVSNISFSNSILNFWPEQPHLDKDGTIIFSGVTPGGFIGPNRNLLFSVFFKALKEGRANLEMKNGLALLDDGAGTESNLKLGSGSILITAKSSSATTSASEKLLQELNPKNDKEIPESFAPLIGNNGDLFDGKYFLVFTTNDKQSGIDYYEVQESKNKSTKDNAWIKGESPYLLSDQSLQSFVFVRAFDKAKNTRTEILSPLHPQKFYQSLVFWVIIIVVCFLFFLLKRRPVFFHHEK